MLITDKLIKICRNRRYCHHDCLYCVFYLREDSLPSNVQKLTTEEMKRPELLADKLNVPEKVAVDIVKEIPKAKPVQIVTVPAAHAPAEVKKIVETKPADKTA
jgi:hypothetical protein